MLVFAIRFYGTAGLGLSPTSVLTLNVAPARLGRSLTLVGESSTTVFAWLLGTYVPETRGELMMNAAAIECIELKRASGRKVN